MFASEITINGRILVNGKGGTKEDKNKNSVEGGGGGGSGGSLTLSACKITFATFGADIRLAANGGNGGDGAIGEHCRVRLRCDAPGHFLLIHFPCFMIQVKIWMRTEERAEEAEEAAAIF